MMNQRLRKNQRKDTDLLPGTENQTMADWDPLFTSRLKWKHLPVIVCHIPSVSDLTIFSLSLHCPSLKVMMFFWNCKCTDCSHLTKFCFIFFISRSRNRCRKAQIWCVAVTRRDYVLVQRSSVRLNGPSRHIFSLLSMARHLFLSLIAIATKPRKGERDEGRPHKRLSTGKT